MIICRRIGGLLLLPALLGPAHAAPLGTAFTYQGEMREKGVAANGLFDFEAALFTVATAGVPTATVTVDDAQVSEGLFTLQLDFGAAPFATASEYFLEVRVRDGASTGGFTQLLPRQKLTAAPYALSVRSLPSGIVTSAAIAATAVDAAAIADAAVGASEIATNAVGTSEINASQVQRRVGGTCAVGQSIRVINQDGTVSCELDDGANAWSLGGNVIDNPATRFLGSTNDQALELRVNNQRALRLAPNAASPNLIGGHAANEVTAGVRGATIAGGGSTSDHDYPGNRRNQVTDLYGSVGGGSNNQAGNDDDDTDNASFATVGGGSGNTASAYGCTVAGGVQNTATRRSAQGYSTVGGGFSNTAMGDYVTVGGGGDNTADNNSATVAGGRRNAAAGSGSAVGGGNLNTASGDSSAVPGGDSNTAGGSFSFAAGRRAKALGDGQFSFADSSDFDFSSTTANAFRVRATGGVRFVVGIDGSGGTAWSCLLTNGTSWSCSSDRDQKENFQPVDGEEVLERLRRLPLSTWNGKGADPAVRHMGPTAQDFHTAFDLGGDDKMISTIDLDGVALAAIQGLDRKLEAGRDALRAETDAEIAALRRANAALEARLDALEARLR